MYPIQRYKKRNFSCFIAHCFHILFSLGFFCHLPDRTFFRYRASSSWMALVNKTKFLFLRILRFKKPRNVRSGSPAQSPGYKKMRSHFRKRRKRKKMLVNNWLSISKSYSLKIHSSTLLSYKKRSPTYGFSGSKIVNCSVNYLVSTFFSVNNSFQPPAKPIKLRTELRFMMWPNM